MQTSIEIGSLDDALEPRISEGLTKLALAGQQRSWRDANAVGLSSTQVQILAFLHRKVKGPAALNVVARSLGLTAPTVSDAIRILGVKGLVQKDRDPAQPRSLALKLTDAGHMMAQQIAQWPNSLSQAVDVLTPNEQTVFVRGLSKIIRQMHQRGEIPVARLCVTCVNFQPNRHESLVKPHHCVLLDAPIGDQNLRLDCGEHRAAPPEQQAMTWARWLEPEQLH
ncbi:MarR family winged helix-turn-helix transcriptional regulator [Deinococcus sp. QL22]|uniref:MarR family winged helix-turn-helix transcriptional regulator n=1 Tax=Deinococcus sp. QL22 TaxID=2939437 RepID=UPI002016D175|nr:MarR family winged helix-turn-helix transcriptional regulator [Deinococcus sp. QL22]UQN08153.1 MarR family winged helix-turn-helix transcriptional regulator [Deinococcus sp. QL22]